MEKQFKKFIETIMEDHRDAIMNSLPQTFELDESVTLDKFRITNEETGETYPVNLEQVVDFVLGCTDWYARFVYNGENLEELETAIVLDDLRKSLGIEYEMTEEETTRE